MHPRLKPLREISAFVRGSGEKRAARENGAYATRGDTIRFWIAFAIVFVGIVVVILTR